MKEKERGIFLQFIARHQYGLIWFSVYLFLFVAAVRFDWVVALVSSTVAVGGMLLLDQFLKRVLIKHLLRSHRQLYYYVASFVTLYLMVWGLVHFEIKIFSFLCDQKIVVFGPDIKIHDMIYPIFKIAVLLLGTFAITTASYLLSQAKESKRKTDMLKNEKLDMELRYLKAQINPHFLFNALNNIYSLVYTNDENAAESILKLSEMLRYVTDECQTDKISIAKEVKYIENFIDFQLMRMENSPNIEFVREIENPEFKLPPMILQPLIENSFKHSRLENNSDGFIRIRLIQNAKEFCFIAENSQSSCVFNKQSERGGIGVTNVRKRLDLAYGRNYTFDIENNSHFYKVELHVKL